MSFVAFGVGALASGACMWELSLALDEYSASANPRRYRGVLEAARGPSALNWSVSAVAGEWRAGRGGASLHTHLTRLAHQQILKNPNHTAAQIYTAEAWSKGEHPKFTDVRSKWNGAVVAARDAVVDFFDTSKK